MVLTRSQARAAFNHVLDNVLGRGDKSHLKSTLLQEGINDIFSLVTYPFQYDPYDQDILGNIELHDKNLLYYLSEYVIYQNASGDPIQDDWMNVTQESFHSFCLNHNYRIIQVTSSVNNKTDDVMEIDSYHEEQPSFIGDSDGEKIDPSNMPSMAGEQTNSLDLSDGEDEITETESENESGPFVEKQSKVKLSNTHSLFQKYQKSMDSLQNAMQVMEDKWMGKCSDCVYYSDESSDDSSVQVSWPTGMNTEIALTNGEDDWVVFKKKEARMQYAKRRWIESLPRDKQDFLCDDNKMDFYPTVSDNKTDSLLPMEISYTKGGAPAGNAQVLPNDEESVSVLCVKDAMSNHHMMTKRSDNLQDVDANIQGHPCIATKFLTYKQQAQCAGQGISGKWLSQNTLTDKECMKLNKMGIKAQRIIMGHTHANHDYGPRKRNGSSSMIQDSDTTTSKGNKNPPDSKVLQVFDLQG
jgi:hypothetical protein